MRTARAGDETPAAAEAAKDEKDTVLFFVISCEVFIAPVDRFVMGLRTHGGHDAVFSILPVPTKSRITDKSAFRVQQKCLYYTCWCTTFSDCHFLQRSAG